MWKVESNVKVRLIVRITPTSIQHENFFPISLRVVLLLSSDRSNFGVSDKIAPGHGETGYGEKGNTVFGSGW